jgi:DNA primase large subunit
LTWQKTAKALPTLDEDNRILPILDNLSQGFLAGIPGQWSSNTSEDVEGITADMVDDLAKRHWPACMRSMHSQLRRDRHLKHFGRLNYGLFLKVDLRLFLTLSLAH